MSQELMSRVPDGYRAATPEEAREILGCGMAVHRANAELEAARQRLEETLREADAAQRNLDLLHGRLGIEGGPEDMRTLGRDIFILVDKEKRRRADMKQPRGRAAFPKVTGKKAGVAL